MMAEISPAQAPLTFSIYYIDQTNMESCDQGVMDDIYGIVWSATPVGSSDTQPCPNLNGRETQGLASRWCLPGQVWGSMVDVSRCENVRIANLRESGVSDVISCVSQILGKVQT